ncbi:alpha-ketoglutarate-dependent dioxygenase AlkB [Actinomadura meridiana]|uniref:Alpha-ketoglutarate-dependent dioxygenase AlkB n=1 Tax=Actinomadura meridiana TaxID=559626 RepID=A0ABP8CE63_9ACTN
MFQASLLDDTDEGGPRPLSSARRTRLAHGAWVDVLPGWLPGADALFERLLTSVPWRAERRHMYDRVVDVPRLLAFYDERDELPDPVLDELKAALNDHYAAELGEPFRTSGLCLYRDGRDSVAWHGDRIGRGATEDTMVAILSLGTPRPLLLRPRNAPHPNSTTPTNRSPTHGGASGNGSSAGERGGTVRFEVGHGDLVVMGGSCQRTWEHAVPKSARATGPRISVQFRPRGVR